MLDGVQSYFKHEGVGIFIVGSWHVQLRSKSVLLVRDQELQLFEHCLRWSAARVDVLQQNMARSQPKGAKAASGEKKMMEEL